MSVASWYTVAGRERTGWQAENFEHARNIRVSPASKGGGTNVPGTPASLWVVVADETHCPCRDTSDA